VSACRGCRGHVARNHEGRAAEASGSSPGLSGYPGLAWRCEWEKGRTGERVEDSRAGVRAHKDAHKEQTVPEFSRQDGVTTQNSPAACTATDSRQDARRDRQPGPAWHMVAAGSRHWPIGQGAGTYP
jgi:hypothetical protein